MTNENVSPGAPPLITEALRGGSVQYPRLRSPITLKAEEVGGLEIRSGRLRVSLPHGFAHEPALDAELPIGSWSVSRLRDETEGRSSFGFFGDVLVAPEGVPDHMTWVEATAGGRSVPFRGDQLVIGDADLELLLGSGIGAASYPRLPWIPDPSEAEAVADELRQLEEWRRKDQKKVLRLLLPTSTVAAYISERGLEWWLHPQFGHRGFGRIWLGQDDTGTVRCVLVDRSTQLDEWEDPPRVSDAWADSVGSGGARLDPGSKLPVEDATASSLFDETQTSEIFYLGEAALDGPLVVAQQQFPIPQFSAKRISTSGAGAPTFR